MAFGDKILEIRNKEAEYTKKDRTAGMLMHFSWTLAPFAVGTLSNLPIDRHLSNLNIFLFYIQT